MSSSFVAVRALASYSQFQTQSFSRSCRTAINNGNAPWRSYANTSKVSSKQAKGPSSSSSGGSAADGKNLDPPKAVFKQVDNSKLGPGASKQSDYKNPEYFSYHRMTYAEMDVVMAKMRVPQPSCK